MRKNFKITTKLTALILLSALLLCGCNAKPSEDDSENTGAEETVIPSAPEWTDSFVLPEKEDGDIRIVQISDPHYYSMSLTDGGERYTASMENAGGRDALHIGEILDAFIEKMKEEKPDAVIVSGDLTMNGEKQSHEDFALLLSELENSGIPVFVIPGNHDINSPNPTAIYESGLEGAENITADDFKKIYSEFGFNEAVSEDENSLSYAVRVGHVTLLMLDTCIYKNTVKAGGSFSYPSRKWAYQVIEDETAAGQTVITVTHHNTLTHNEYFESDYTLGDNLRFVQELMQRGVKLNLSGHLHIMNIVSKDSEYYDIAMSCIAVWPNLYGQIDVKPDGEIYFSAHRVAHESDSFRYLYGSFRGSAKSYAELYGLSDEDAELMNSFSNLLNIGYFSGKIGDRENLLSDPAYALWMSLPEDAFRRTYIEEAVNSEMTDNTFLHIESSSENK